MPVLTNPRHEKFAQLLAQLHGEMTVTDAHEQAGYKRNDGNASTLAKHPDVEARVKEIKGAAAARSTVLTQITTERLVQMADQFRQRALDSGQSAPASLRSRRSGC
jgi:hypothetical protein